MNANSQLCFCMNRRSFKLCQNSISKALVQKGILFLPPASKICQNKNPYQLSALVQRVSSRWVKFLCTHSCLLIVLFMSTVLPAIDCMLQKIPIANRLINSRDSDLLPMVMYMLKLKIFQKQLCNVSKGPQSFFKQYHPQYPQRELYSLELNPNSHSVSLSKKKTSILNTQI